MKKYAHILLTILPGVTLVLYTISIPPNIGQPITLSIFFLLIVLSLVSFTHFLLGPMKGRRRKWVWSVITGLFFSYLIALGSLGALSLANLTVAVFVLSAMLFLVDRSKI